MPKRIGFTILFLDKMFNNMWTFMNEDMILHMLKKELKVNKVTGFSAMKNVDDDRFKKNHAHTICFKGPRTGGHWVYVDRNLKAHSTYEDNLIDPDDDGVCHGAAMIYAIGANKPGGQFPLIPNPKTVNEYKNNYKSILKFYIYLIESGKWDKALAKFFAGDISLIVKGTTVTIKETDIAYKELKTYIPRFD